MATAGAKAARKGSREVHDVAQHEMVLSDTHTHTHTHTHMAGIETVGKEIKEVRNAAQHEMVLSEASEPDKVVAYLQGLQEQVQRLAVEATRINKYQVLFKVRGAMRRNDKISQQGLGCWSLCGCARA